MSSFYAILRGVLYCLGIAVWMVCAFYSGVIVFAWYEYWLDPAGNKLVGIVWFLVGPAVPITACFAAGLLYAGRETFDAVVPRLFKLAWLSIQFLIVGFIIGFFLPGLLITVGLMGAVLLLHVVVVLLSIAISCFKGHAPWMPLEASEAG